jgi:hypothetical protein
MTGNQKFLVVLRRRIQARILNEPTEGLLAVQLCELHKSSSTHMSRSVLSRAVRDAFNMHWKTRALKGNSLKGVWPIDEEHAMQKLVNDICKEIDAKE